MRVLKMRDFISWSHESIPKIPSSHRVFLGKRDPNSQMKRKAGIRIAAIISIQQASSQGEITVTESPFIRRHLDAQSHLFLNCQSLSRCSLSLSFSFFPSRKMTIYNASKEEHFEYTYGWFERREFVLLKAVLKINFS
jgi:hypothetical protein